MANYQEAAKFVRDERESAAAGQMSLFGEEDLQKETFTMAEQDDYSFNEKLDHEKNLLGFYVSGHPLQLYQKAWERCVHINLAAPETIKENKIENVIGMVKEMKEITTKKNTKMAKITVSDFNGSADLTVFTDCWEKMSQVIQKDGIYGFRGKFSTFKDQLSMTVERFFQDPNEMLTLSMKDCYIEISKKECCKKALQEISDILLKHEGTLASHIILSEDMLSEDYDEDEPETAPKFVEKKTAFLLGSSFCVKCDQTLLDDLEQNQAVRKAWFE